MPKITGKNNQQDGPGWLSDTPDRSLVQRVRNGDEDALSVLYRRYVGAIYGFILAQVRDQHDAEDLTSETFARMLHGIQGFRGEASFKNWLYQIARNAVRNHRRSFAYRRLVPLPNTLPAAERQAEANTANGAAAAKALALLSGLPPRYRRVLELRFLQGRTISDTADEMGISVSNAKVLQHRALKKVARLEEAKQVGRTTAG